jgi:hypothetical protein
MTHSATEDLLACRLETALALLQAEWDAIDHQMQVLVAEGPAANTS